MTTFWQVLKGETKGALWSLKWLFIWSLPFSSFPIINGVVTGVLFSFWYNQHFEDVLTAFHDDMANARSDWGVGGGAPSFRKFEDTNNVFQVTRINTNDWTSKLKLALPNEYTTSPTIPIEGFGALDVLVRSTLDSDAPVEQWVYLTRWGWPIIDPFDFAFSDVIERSYLHPHLNASSFFLAECATTAKYLCRVWNAQYPALLHLRVENDTLDPDELAQSGFTYAEPFFQLQKVTARLIELPLRDAYLGLPAGQFPGPKEQMQAVVFGEDIVDQFAPFEANDVVNAQLWVRYLEYANGLRDGRSTIYFYWGKFDDWVEKHVFENLGMKEEILEWQDLVGLLTTLMMAPVIMVGKSAMQLVGAFLGRPSAEDWEYTEPSGDTDGDWLKDAMMGGFMDFLDNKMRESQGSVVTPAPSSD